MRRRYLAFVGGLALLGCTTTEPTPATVTFCPSQVVGGRIYIRNDVRIPALGGEWIAVDSPDGNSFTFVAPRRLSIAFSTSDNTLGSYLQVFQLTSDEVHKLNCTQSPAPLRVFSGTLAGIPTGRSAQVWFGTASTTRGNGSYTLQTLSTGAADLVSFLRIGTTSVEKFIVRRALDLPGGSTIDPIDFTSAEAASPRLNTVTIAPGGTSVTSTSYRLLTKGTNVGLPAVVSAGTIGLAALPASLQTPDDFYVLAATSITGGTVPSGRGVWVRFTNPADRALTFGPALVQATSNFAAVVGPTTIRLTLPVQSEYAARADVRLSQSDGAFIRSVSMTMTRDYRGDASSWYFETPDPAALPLMAVQLDPSAATSWITTGASGDYPTLYLSKFDDEVTIREAFRDGTVAAGGQSANARRTLGDTALKR